MANTNLKSARNKSESLEREAFEEVKRRIGRAESNHDYTAKNPQKGATAYGKYQFVDRTWDYINKKYHNGTLERDNPEHQEMAMNSLLSENAEGLKRHNIPINSVNLYGSHFLGVGGYTQYYKNGLLKHSEGDILDYVSEDAYKWNKSVFDSMKTNKDFYKWLGKKVGAKVKFEEEPSQWSYTDLENNQSKMVGSIEDIPPQYALTAKEHPNDRLDNIYVQTVRGGKAKIVAEPQGKESEWTTTESNPYIGVDPYAYNSYEMLQQNRNLLLEQVNLLKEEKEREKSERKAKQQQSEAQQKLLEKQQKREFLTRAISSLGVQYIDRSPKN